MKLTFFQVSGVGFSDDVAMELIGLGWSLADYLGEETYSDEIHRLWGAYAIYKPELQKFFPKPRLKHKREILGLDVKFYVDYDTALAVTGKELRACLAEPFCKALLQTPKSTLKRIRIPELIADINAWVDL